jgi:hypothetical protein
VIASLEDPNLLNEGRYFINLQPEEKPLGFDQDPKNHNINEIEPGNGQTKSGVGILLKVNAGDRLKTSVFAHYKSNETLSANTDISNIANDIATGINTSFARQMGNEAAALVQQTNTNWISSLLNFLTTANQHPPTMMMY